MFPYSQNFTIFSTIKLVLSLRISKRNILAYLIFTMALWVLFPVTTVAQNNPVHFESLSLQKGVSLNLTYSMIQDRKGYIWFATMYGLVKYDGQEYTTYRNDPRDSTSISFDDIISIFEDSQGYIWAGTWGGGLNKYDPETGKFSRYLYNKNNPDGICDNIVWSINEDKSGNIWVGTQRGGIDKITTTKMVHYQNVEGDENSLPSNSIMKIFVDKDGTVWVGTQKGLAKYLPVSDNFQNYIYDEGSKNTSVNNIHDIMRDSKNRLIVATSAGLYTLNKSSKKLEPILKDKSNLLVSTPVLRLAEDKSHNIWAGTSYYGLIKIIQGEANNTEIFKHSFENKNSLVGNRVISLMVDKAGVLWASAYQAGISKIIDRKQNFTHYSYSPNDQNSPGTYYITFFTSDEKGNVWIVGYNSVLTKFNPVTNKFKRFPLIQSYPKKNNSFLISSLALDKNYLWIGTTKGILLFDINKEKQIEVPADIKKKSDMAFGNITYLLLTSDHKLWAGVYEKCVFYFDLDDRNSGHYINPNNELADYWKNIAQVIYEDKKHDIWVGSLGGLLKLDRSTGKFKTYSHNLSDPESLSNNYVYFLTEDSKDNFWVGTSNGLNKFDKGKDIFTTYDEKDGLPNNVIMSILEDSNSNLWISTNKGISRFDVENKSSKNFSVNDGLSSNIFFAQSALKTKNGRFFFGGNDGFTSFYPSQIKLNNYIPPVYITKVKAGKDIGNLENIYQAGSKIISSFNKNFFEIKFASLDFTNPAKNIYKYKLDGIDENWVYSGNNNTAVYTDLLPGTYKFQVMGSNSDGVWNEKPATMELIITPPFWRTWWFSTITFLLILSLIYFTHYKRTRE